MLPQWSSACLTRLPGYSTFERATYPTILVGEMFRQLNHHAQSTWHFLVFFAYAIVTLEKATLFINEKQVGQDVRKHLGDLAEIRPYEEIFSHLENLKASLAGAKHKVKTFVISFPRIY